MIRRVRLGTWLPCDWYLSSQSDLISATILSQYCQIWLQLVFCCNAKLRALKW